MDTNKKILLHLSLIQGVGPNSILKILKKIFDLNFDLSKLYGYKIADFSNVFGVHQKMADLLVKGFADKDMLEKELELIEKYKIDVITFLDAQYPQDLKEIYSPPIVLYCKGEELKNYTKNIAIVGARKANYYANDVIAELVPELVKNDFSIVSGGALGVDSKAHEHTVNSGGKTVVVLGSGLLNAYPRSNKNLFRRVVQNGGTLVSPFPLLMDPIKGNFPARNRVIAGLSKGCIVVQAAKKSGALITAHFALEQGRQVFAVPGSIHDELSVGCHELLKQGAKLVGGIDDILEEFGHTASVQDDQPEEVQEAIGEDVPVCEKEKAILYHLQSACSLDELSVKTKLDFTFLQDKLFEMQIEGKVEQNVAGFWERI